MSWLTPALAHGARRVVVARSIARLEVLLSGGLPPTDALAVSVIAGGPEGRALSAVQGFVRRGLSLSTAFLRARWALAAHEIALVEAGESSGNLAAAVAALHRRLSRHAGTRRRLAQVLVYPALLLAVTLAVITPMSLWVLPSFAALYGDAGVGLPASTRFVMFAGQALCRHGPLVTVACAGLLFAAVGIGRLSPRAGLLFDKLALLIPIVGRMLRANARAELYEVLAALLHAGVDLDDALIFTAPVCANTELRRRFEGVRPAVQRGVTLSAAIGRSGIDARAQDAAMLRSAEAIGDYPGCLARMAAAAQLERDDLLERTARAIEPTTVALMAVIVGATVLAVYQPVLGSATLLAGGLP